MFGYYGKLFYIIVKLIKIKNAYNNCFRIYLLNFKKKKKTIGNDQIAILLILDCVPKVNYNTPIF